MDTQLLGLASNSPNSECKCNCHPDTLSISNKLNVLHQENKSLISRIEELEHTLNASNAQIAILNEKNAVLKDLAIQHTQKYKDVVSENEKLKLHQQYAPKSHDIDQDINKQEQIQRLQQDIKSLKELNTNLIIDSNKFKASIQTLQFQLENKDKLLIEIQKDKTCHENTIHEMGQTLDMKDKQINSQNLEIHRLKEEKSLLSNDDTEYQPVTESMQKTIHQDFNGFSTNLRTQQFINSSIYGGSDVFDNIDDSHHQFVHRTSSYAPFPDDDEEDEDDGDQLISNNGSSNQIEMEDLRKSNDDLLEEVKKLKEYIRENIVE